MLCQFDIGHKYVIKRLRHVNLQQNIITIQLKNKYTESYLVRVAGNCPSVLYTLGTINQQ